MTRSYYTKEKIINDCSSFIEHPEKFYSECRSILNRKSQTTDSKKYCTEEIANYIYTERKKLNEIKSITRLKPYKQDSHTIINISSQKPLNTKSEKEIAKEICMQSKESGPYEYIGKIIDFEIPLNENNKDGNGDIDLLSYCKETQTSIILELKKPTSNESMLLCVLECYTYYKILDNKKLIQDYPELSGCNKIKAAPLVFAGENSRPWREYEELLNGKRPELEKLMGALHTWPYYIETKNGKYKIYQPHK